LLPPSATTLTCNNRRAVAIPLYCAFALSAAGLLLTLKAAPIMLSLARAQPDVAIQHAFDEFFLWGLYFRGTADTLAFVAQVWALANLQRRTD